MESKASTHGSLTLNIYTSPLHLLMSVAFAWLAQLLCKKIVRRYLCILSKSMIIIWICTFALILTMVINSLKEASILYKHKKIERNADPICTHYKHFPLSKKTLINLRYFSIFTSLIPNVNSYKNWVYYLCILNLLRLKSTAEIELVRQGSDSKWKNSIIASKDTEVMHRNKGGTSGPRGSKAQLLDPSLYLMLLFICLASFSPTADRPPALGRESAGGSPSFTTPKETDSLSVLFISVSVKSAHWPLC